MKNIISNWISKEACFALKYEPTIWPRFGLVGSADTGSHVDMDYSLLCSSADSLFKFFTDTCLLGMSFNMANDELFYYWRLFCIQAEHNMLKVTKGTNTHKGAMFLLGLIILSWGSLWKEKQEKPIITSRLCVTELLDKAFDISSKTIISEIYTHQKATFTETYGEWCIRRYKWKGIRGLIENNFTILKTAFFLYKKLNHPTPLKLGYCRHYFMAFSEDSNLVKRGGYDNTISLLKYSRKLLRNGSIFFQQDHIVELENHMVHKKQSSAASGDLLVVLIFLLRIL